MKRTRKDLHISSFRLNFAAKAFNSSHNIKGVHLIVRNTKTWSNAELRKLCNISELEKNDVDTDDPDGE